MLTAETRSVTLLAGLMLVLSGCAVGSGATAGSGALTVGAAQAQAPAADGCPSLPIATTLAAGTTPTAVLECTNETERVPGDGEWWVAVNTRATGGLEPLVTALRLPSAKLTTAACTADLRLPTQVQLEAAGARVLVNTPTDSCGKTRPEVLDAYGALTWVTVSTVRLWQVRPEAAMNPDCQPWKDMIAISAASAPSGSPGPALAPSNSIIVCRYLSSYPPGWTPESNVGVDGKPRSGAELTAKDSSLVLEELDASGPARPCASRHTQFAVVSSAGRQAYVELDGCLRILAADGSLRQGNATLVALLTQG